MGQRVFAAQINSRVGGSPIGTLNYQTYSSIDEVNQSLLLQKDQIQCVVGPSVLPNALDFGQTQRPLLHDYADGIDPIKFVLSLY